jgi:hypothetical protein
MSVRTARRSRDRLHRPPALQRPDHRQHQRDLQQAHQQPAGGAVAVFQQVAQAQRKHQRLHHGLKQPLLHQWKSVCQPVHARCAPHRRAQRSSPVGRVLAQRGKAEAARLQARDQRLQHRRRPGVLARPDAQVRQQDVAGADVGAAPFSAARRSEAVSLGSSSPRKPAGAQPTCS